MRFMMIVKASKEYEDGQMPSEELMAAMGKYNEELIKAGVLVDLAGLHPSSEAARIEHTQGKRTVIDGPFAETKESIGGYWIIKADSRAEAIEWALKAPAPHGEGRDAAIEVRRIFDLEEFPAGPAIDQARKLEKQLR